MGGFYLGPFGATQLFLSNSPARATPSGFDSFSLVGSSPWVCGRMAAECSTRAQPPDELTMSRRRASSSAPNPEQAIVDTEEPAESPRLHVVGRV